jgi:hypothetical protein
VRRGAIQRYSGGPSGVCSKASSACQSTHLLTRCILDEILLKNRLKRRWQVTMDPTLKARVNRLQRSVTHRLNECRNEQWSDALESLDSADQSLWKLTRRVMRVPTPSPILLVPRGTGVI